METIYVHKHEWEPDEIAKEWIKKAKETLKNNLKMEIVKSINLDLPGAEIYYLEPKIREMARASGKYVPSVQVYINDPQDFENLAKTLKREIMRGDITEPEYFDDGEIRYINKSGIFREIAKSIAW
ncbi:MAG: hypothetical protein QXQ40_00865 [Candidatus Aenigmatarchaeota archaeon]